MRRAFLRGTDDFSGNDFSHRKQWVIERLQVLVQVFAIDVSAYAVMSNHYHVVLHVDKSRALGWTEDDVIQRWTEMFGLPVLVQRYQQGQTVSHAERNKAQEIIEQWRSRFYDISWFMRCLNEHLARAANKEDQYAGIARTPEDSEDTSIQQRILAFKNTKTTPILLKAFHQRHHNDTDATLPFKLKDYLELVDWSGRMIRKNKPGAIDTTLPSILTRLNIDPDSWQEMMQPNGNFFQQAIGRLDSLKRYATRLNQSWCQGVTQSIVLFPA